MRAFTRGVRPMRDGGGVGARSRAVVGSLAVVCVALFPDAVPAAAAGAPVISDVRAESLVLRSGNPVGVSFRLSGPAKVSLLIHDPDYAVVRRLLDAEPRGAGVVTASWDGRDDAGRPVPDEAYLVAVLAEGPEGQRAAYDPTAQAGGEALAGLEPRLEPEGSGFAIVYTLEHPARVSARAGIHKGPMLRTVLPWTPQEAGAQRVAWDGRDDTGRIDVMREAGATIHVQGYRLPPGTIIVRGQGGDYPAYHRLLAPGSPILSSQVVRLNVQRRAGSAVSSAFLARQSLSTAPPFRVLLGGEAAGETVRTLSGEVAMTVEVAPDGLTAFNESRYEIVVFIDNQRFDEEEQANSSYTYRIDTQRLSNGEHAVSVNMVGISGQIGSYSFRVKVAN